MSLIIPPIDEELNRLLIPIIQKKPNESWGLIYSQIILRLKLIALISIEDGETYNTFPADVDLKDLIASISEKVIKQLQSKFQDEPPFTLLRLSELIMDPIENGYSLVNNVSVLKYFNSLHKLVTVCSTIGDYERDLNQKTEDIEINGST